MLQDEQPADWEDSLKRHAAYPMLVRGTRLDACAIPVAVLGVALILAWIAVTNHFPWPIPLAVIPSLWVLNWGGVLMQRSALTRLQSDLPDVSKASMLHAVKRDSLPRLPWNR
ncbi:hypothetical protein [Rugosimonospora africana]|uniref:Uncharacterized protein n=1 Tax=Rugosimonospora africana TaxID=556532 RepID=A0A8J3QWL4_9ACTN|nr:hypothetical protein [Rugosimonospora africana]GIH18213.1 hypothetical protein Raf01_63850 [Rugosimonospora africana]